MNNLWIIVPTDSAGFVSEDSVYKFEARHEQQALAYLEERREYTDDDLVLTLYRCVQAAPSVSGKIKEDA